METPEQPTGLTIAYERIDAEGNITNHTLPIKVRVPSNHMRYAVRHIVNEYREVGKKITENNNALEAAALEADGGTEGVHSSAAFWDRVEVNSEHLIQQNDAVLDAIIDKAAMGDEAMNIFNSQEFRAGRSLDDVEKVVSSFRGSIRA